MNTRSNFIKKLGIPLITMVMVFLTVEARANESANVKAHPVKLDAQGCRVLSPLPPPGVHPRIFFTAADLPAMRARLAQPALASKVAAIREKALRKLDRKLEERDFTRNGMTNREVESMFDDVLSGSGGDSLAGLLDEDVFDEKKNDPRADWPDEFAGVTDKDILRYFKGGVPRGDSLGVMSLFALLEGDEKLAARCRKILCNWSRVILAGKERAAGLEEMGRKSKDFDIELFRALVNVRPSIKRWHVENQWQFGTPGFPLAYDVLYNGMSDEERDLVRRAIAAVTEGRWSHGMGAHPGGASSNHYGYHGDLAVMVAAIEGEPGFDKKVWDGISQVLRDYWEVGWTPFGACHEDWYGPNHGLRAGGRGLMVLARRGYNAFATEKFPQFMINKMYEHDPYPGGLFNGGASGGPGGIGTTSTMIAHYMYPQNTVANFNWRHKAGETYNDKGGLDFLLFGDTWKGPETRQIMLESTGLPLAKHFPVRGKYIARSDWSDDAMYLALDARPDAHQIGHDKVDRGNFTMSALGRRWATTGMFYRNNLSTENNLVHIDGKSQTRKAPSVRFLMTNDDGGVASAVADLKYAYDWKWLDLGNPNPKQITEASEAGWKPEPNSPIDLGWPEEWSDSPACPDLVHGSQIHYYGLYHLYRQPYNPVQKALRSTQLVRGKWPYAIISDDLRKDDSAHIYAWYMQMRRDLKIESQEANQVVLAEKEGDRAMLVRFLQQASCEIVLDTFEIRKKDGEPVMSDRLIASCTAVDPQFRVLLYPFRKGDPLPKITGGKGEFTISIGEQVDQLSLVAISKDRAGVSVTRH